MSTEVITPPAGTPAASNRVPPQASGSAAPDLIDELCELLRQSGARVVFWTCPECPSGRVSWTHAKDKSTPRCEQCGKQGDAR